jgi:hypothetical protein
VRDAEDGAQPATDLRVSSPNANETNSVTDSVNTAAAAAVAAACESADAEFRSGARNLLHPDLKARLKARSSDMPTNEIARHAAALCSATAHPANTVGLRVRPRRGDALLFRADAPQTWHSGCLVHAGDKWTLTKFREPPPAMPPKREEARTEQAVKMPRTAPHEAMQLDGRTNGRSTRSLTRSGRVVVDGWVDDS